MNTQDKINLIERRLKAFVPVIDIANELSVSRIRVYQLIEQAMINLPSKKVREGSREEKRAFYLLRRKKVEVKGKGLECNIRPEDILPIPTHCPYLGIELDYASDKGDNKAVLGMINPNLGLVKGNVTVCSYRANHIKGDATPEELHKICKALDKLNKTDV